MALPVEIEVWAGEISELEVDALVVPATESLFMTAPIAAAVKRHAGDEVERAAVAQGPVSAGSVVVTGGGRLPAPYIVHAVAVGHDLHADSRRLRSAIRASLTAIEHLSLRRVAVSPLGTERGVFAAVDAARILVRELIAHGERRNGSPETVVIALPRSEDLDAYRAAVDEALRVPAAAPLDGG